MSEDDELWTLVQTLVRKSASDALAKGAAADNLAAALHAELQVLGKRAGRTQPAFRDMIVREIEAAIAAHRANDGSSGKAR